LVVRLVAAITITSALCLVGCKTGESINEAITPSNDRNWAEDQAILPYAKIKRDKVTVHNVRNCSYISADEYIVDHHDKTYDLNRLKSVDFVVVPFKTTAALAHTMLSFGFEDEDYLAVSVEVRKEQGETYSAAKGLARQYELMYVIAEERDLIRLRTNFRGDDVYVYRVRATPEQVRALFLDVMRRANDLKRHPEFYDTFANNCTTNIADHVNRLNPGKVPMDYRVLLPGYSAQMAYELGLLATDTSFEETKRRANVTAKARQHADSPLFSQLIRQ
jgi:hypothetical protein